MSGIFVSAGLGRLDSGPPETYEVAVPGIPGYTTIVLAIPILDGLLEEHFDDVAKLYGQQADVQMRQALAAFKDHSR